MCANFKEKVLINRFMDSSLKECGLFGWESFYVRLSSDYVIFFFVRLATSFSRNSNEIRRLSCALKWCSVAQRAVVKARKYQMDVKWSVKSRRDKIALMLCCSVLCCSRYRQFISRCLNQRKSKERKERRQKEGKSVKSSIAHNSFLLFQFETCK